MLCTILTTIHIIRDAAQHCGYNRHMSNNVYIPGVCNIGPAEIRMRRVTGIVGLIATLLFFAWFYLYPIDPLGRLLIFIPATTAASGFLQAQLHFCARFGMQGLFNFSSDIRKQESVDQAAFRRKDQQKALIIIAGSAAIGLAVALVAFWLPFAN